jgi:hypothetical protein
LRQFVTALFFGLCFAVSAGTQQVQAQSATFCFTNNSSYILYVRAFSTSRNALWPANASWVLNDRSQRCASLACIPGEQICYGATNGAGGEWGVGYNATSGCPDCCGVCNNGTYSWNLID